MNLLLLVAALGLAGALPLEDDKVCQPHTRPWQVYLHGEGTSCSGALVDHSWIVTSFTCALSSSSIIASLGEQDLTVAEGTEQHIEVDFVIRHSPYRSALHSLAMLRLSRPAQFNQYVKPIPLPSRCPQAGETCQVSGWGSTIPNQHEPWKQLKCINVPVVDDNTCRNMYPMYWTPGMVCAGQANRDNCLRDSGAVMVCGGQLHGIQWYPHGCSNPADPSAYTDLCEYNRWMRDVMQRYGPTSLPPTTPPFQAHEGAKDLHNNV